MVKVKFEDVECQITQRVANRKLEVPTTALSKEPTVFSATLKLLLFTDNEEAALLDKWTPAQVAFEKMQEIWQMERILQKASKTHKPGVQDFSRHLDTLTEHYNIPKRSWTK
ncbi:Protein FAM32A [Sciurus carolinensis]|uniref:Protein FAM32A n=1 Tax=Sciurus carolinensis TaxID=30640 RepID=A0AA41N0H0_SCICA|nr:Protein FAM32A [Sciurus carolinensis]